MGRSSGKIDGGTNVSLLVNGGVEIWQRGAGTFSANNAYTADRWQLILAGTDTCNVDREAATKKANSLYALKAAFTVGDGAGASRVKQRLTIADGHHGLLGEKVSLRLSAHVSAASAVRAVITTDGTGGTSTYSGYHAGNAAYADLDVVDVAVPSDATYIDVGITLEASATVYVDNIMLVHGAIATAYEPLAPAQEWDRCLRYYEVCFGIVNQNAFIMYASGGTTYGLTRPFSARKSATPTMTKNGTWAVTNCGQPLAGAAGVTGFEIQAVATGAGNIAVWPDGADDTITAEANP